MVKMSSVYKRVILLLIVSLLALDVFDVVGLEHAHAADDEDDEIDYYDYCVENGAGLDYKKKVSTFYVKDGDFSPNAYYFWRDSIKDGKRAWKITISSSNCKVAVPIYDVFVDGIQVWPAGFVTKKPGKATLTVNVYKSKKSKKAKRYKCKLTVKKYSNPFKKVSFAGKDITKKYNKTRYKSVNIDAEDGKLVVKAKKGWKIVQIFFEPLYKGDEWIEDYRELYRGRYIKSGELIDLPTDITENRIEFYIMVKRKKTGEERVWTLTVNPYDDEEE